MPDSAGFLAWFRLSKDTNEENQRILETVYGVPARASYVLHDTNVLVPPHEIAITKTMKAALSPAFESLLQIPSA